jgi:nucleotide-binding universal stress UspA family protein
MERNLDVPLSRSYLTRIGLDSPSLRIPEPRQSIIAPLWSLEDADTVLRQATSLAEPLQASVRLVNIRPPDPLDNEDVVVVDDGKSIDFRSRHSDQLSALVKRWSRQTSVDISVTHRTSSDVVNVLAKELDRRQGFVLVQQESASWWSRLWRPNWVQKVINAPFPVLVLPSQWQDNWPRSNRQLRVVVSVSDDKASGVHTVLPITGPEAQYTLLRVLPLWLLESMQWEQSPLDGSLPPAGHARNEAWRYLHNSRTEVERAGGTAETAVVFDGATAGKAILSQADARQADLVVIARRRRLLPRLYHCDWQYLAMNSKRPVLLHSA